MTKSQAMKWVNALRSGKYKQTTSVLQRGHSFCCLGVACMEFIPRDKQLLVESVLKGVTPSEQPNAPKWLKNINEQAKNKIDQILEKLNDQEGMTFDEIADIIQIYWVENE